MIENQRKAKKVPFKRSYVLPLLKLVTVRLNPTIRLESVLFESVPQCSHVT